MPTYRLSTVSLSLIAAGSLVIGLAVPAAAHQASHLINGSTIKEHSIAGDRLKNNTVTGTQINETTLTTVPRAKIATTADHLPGLVWHTITASEFMNGWTNYLSPLSEPPAGYAIDPQGIVHLRGQIAGGTEADPAFALPAVVSRSFDRFLPAVMGAETIGVLGIMTGDVEPLGGPGVTNTQVSLTVVLDGISFPAS
jgi:hypothetical protein